MCPLSFSFVNFLNKLNQKIDKDAGHIPSDFHPQHDEKEVILHHRWPSIYEKRDIPTFPPTIDFNPCCLGVK
jgi:hypothetical protein